jgi:uncharacterized protein with HEPN domain
VSRRWLLYLDDLIGSAEKIGRLVSGRDLEAFTGDEANLEVEIIWDVANRHVPALLEEAHAMRSRAGG